MHATLYYVAEHFNRNCNCVIPGGWKAHFSRYTLEQYEHPIPDQFYGDTAEEAERNIRAEFPEIRTVKVAE